jgi:hypothetical protein
MLILSKSQARNYFKKLYSSSNDEGCGCCSSRQDYEIKGNRILSISQGENQGYRYFKVSVRAKIRKK